MPTSTKPKPQRASPSTASAFLSRPAARPMGFFSTLPKKGRSAPAMGDTCPGKNRAAPRRPWQGCGQSPAVRPTVWIGSDSWRSPADKFAV